MKTSTFSALLLSSCLVAAMIFSFYFPPFAFAFTLIALFCFAFFSIVFEESTRNETFATGNVFRFTNSTAFKTAITRVIQEKMNKLNKIDRGQKKVLDTSKEDGAYHLFIVEAGEKFVKEMRLVFDLSLRTSSFDVAILQKEFAQALRDAKASNSVFFKDLPQESKTSFLYMQGLPELKTN